MKISTTDLDREIEELGTGMLRMVYEHIAQGALSKLAELEARHTARNGAGELTVRELMVQPERQTREIATVAQGGWSDDPAERSREMKRRMAVAKRKREAPEHPREEGHPDHERYMAKQRRAAKKRWNSMSPAKQKAKIRALNAGRRAKAVAA